MSSQSDQSTCGRHLAMTVLMLLASTALNVPAMAQSTSTSDSYAQSRYGQNSVPQLRGTTSYGIGTQSEDKEAGTIPYPGSSTQKDDASASTDPFVASYASSTSPEPDPDSPAATDPRTEQDPEPTTGPARSVDATEAEDNQYGRVNRATGTVDDLQVGSTPDDTETAGIRIGTMTLRPTLTQKIVHEINKFGATSDNRTYSETTLEGTLESDWSRHSLTITGSSTFEKNLSGTSQEEPQTNLDALFNLDISEGMNAQLRAGYDYSREDRTDPNAVVNATAQAGVHNFTSSASLTKSLGHLRGTAAAELGRTIYGDATLAGGTIISGRDRDNTNYGLRTRIGYEVSPNLIPFVEASLNRQNNDIKTDTSGYQRSATTYGLKVGAELPLGEKISGELSVGYLKRMIDDARLRDIGAFSVDGSLNWSPMRGTTVTAGLSTALESSTTANQSGSVVHQLSLGLEHELRAAVVAKLTGTALRRNYQGSASPADQTILGLTGELDWSINRYLSVVTEAGYERTTQPGSQGSSTAHVGIGLRLRR